MKDQHMKIPWSLEDNRVGANLVQQSLQPRSRSQAVRNLENQITPIGELPGERPYQVIWSPEFPGLQLNLP
jgi:hypothetical protein